MPPAPNPSAGLRVVWTHDVVGVTQALTLKADWSGMVINSSVFRKAFA
jgi:hypothetical protein